MAVSHSVCWSTRRTQVDFVSMAVISLRCAIGVCPRLTGSNDRPWRRIHIVRPVRIKRFHAEAGTISFRGETEKLAETRARDTRTRLSSKCVLVLSTWANTLTQLSLRSSYLTLNHGVRDTVIEQLLSFLAFVLSNYAILLNNFKLLPTCCSMYYFNVDVYLYFYNNYRYIDIRQELQLLIY